MKRLLLVFIGISIAGQAVYGQSRKAMPAARSTNATVKLSPDNYPNLKIQAEELNKAFLEKDFDKLADLTHPKVVAMAGGKAKLVEGVSKGMDQMSSAGFAPLSNEIARIDKIEKIGAQLFALMSTSMVIKAPDGKKFATGGSLIGISDDQGKTWTFINAPGQEQFRKIFPAAAAKIAVPERKPPVEIEN